jgi:cyclophilin family peptidyl-prolyl cis-trans isomerase
MDRLRIALTGCAALLVGIAACGGGSPLRNPTPDMLAARAPDSFVVEMVTSEGVLEITMHRAWSPAGVDRAYQLMVNDFYAGARFYRVEGDFVAQWGFSGDPVVDSVWGEHPVPDEPVVGSNTRGVVSFARGGPESRSYTMFVNLSDNTRLDTLAARGIVGYPPIGRIHRGVEVIDGFYGAYRANAPRQDSIADLGNDYLRRSYPQLDSIVSTRVIRRWP